MQIKQGFVLREVAGQYMIIATGEASKNFHGMIKLNESGKDVWMGVKEGLSVDEIVYMMMRKYEDANEEMIRKDVEKIINVMKQHGFLKE